MKPIKVKFKRILYLLAILYFMLVTLQKNEEVHEQTFRALNSFYLPPCPIENPLEEIKNIRVNGTLFQEAKNEYPIINSWYSEIFTNSVDFKNLCNNWEAADLLIFITSGTAKTWISQRQLARTKWLNNTNTSVRYMFVLGLSADVQENQVVLNEAIEFKDILILNFTDTYRNLTLKVMSTMKWIASNCKNIRFVMKTDTDVFVNIPKIAKLINSEKFSSPNAVFGNRASYKNRVIRDPSEKYFQSKEEYSYEFYPPYCTGSGYVMSFSTLKLLLRMSYFIRKISIEDAYQGICAHCAGVKIFHQNGFGLDYHRLRGIFWSFKPEELFSLMTVNNVPSDVVQDAWKMLKT